MKESFINSVKLKIIAAGILAAAGAFAQVDHSYFKQSGPDYKQIPEKIFPLSKYENIETPEEVLNALFKGEGLYSNFNPADEAVELRTRNTKHFRNPDGTMTAVVGSGDLHYWENGKWKEILSHILPNKTGEYNDYEFASVHNRHKMFFPKSPGKPIVVRHRNTLYEDWGQPAMVWLDANANILSEVLFNSSSEGITDKDSLTYSNIFPYTDAVILNSVRTKKLSYILRDASILSNKPAGAVYLAFRESIKTSDAWKLAGTKSSEKIFASMPSGQLLQNIVFTNASDEQELEIKTPLYYEYRPVTLLCSDALKPDSTSHYQGSFLVNENNSAYETYTLVPVHWLTDSNRTFPLIIDPITDYYPGGTLPTYTAYRPDNSGSWFCATGSYAGRIYPNSDISYGWIDDTWPASNPYLDGYATFDIAALPDNAYVSSVQYNWYRYGGRGCGTDITLKLGMVQFNDNLAEEPSCDTIGIRIRNNNSYYNDTVKNATSWQNQTGSIADLVAALPGDQITLGWAYNGGYDCCTSLCGGDDGNYHNVYGYEHSTLKPYVQVDYNIASSGEKELAVGNLQMAIYPNPNDGTFHLRITNLYEFTNMVIRVINVLGQEVFKSQIAKNKTQINFNYEIPIQLKNHETGIYNVQIITNTGIVNKKVVIQ